jgi:ferredoxin-type protein NapG
MPGPTREKSRKVNRRQFVAESAKTACGVGLFGLGLWLYAQRASSLPAAAIRPPGAVAEDEFLGACIRCGLCVRDCPFDTLRLARLGEEVATGTPYFVARDVPCEMCDDIPCVAACPTGALDHQLDDIDQARMGLAVLVDQETCLNYLGLRCDVCYRVCPLIDEAITLKTRHNPRSDRHALFIPTVHSDKCTGCGKCERACVLENAAIKVFPTNLAKGEIGAHYRLGWKEKKSAGKSLVTPDLEHRYNLPEGLQYDHAGEGLIPEGAAVDSPFSDNPLETLNRRGSKP